MGSNTIRLYETDSYIKTFDATVISVHFLDGSHYVELDRTAFFPEGGGQLADVGWLSDAEVSDVQEVDCKILHKVNRKFSCGEKVHGEINWRIRFERMQNHSGEHILSGIIHKIFNLNNVGFHMGDSITFDVDGILSDEDLAAVEFQANEAVYANVPVTAYYPSEEELSSMSYRSKIDSLQSPRIVTIEGYDCCACCAPHVARTGEIGIIKIVDFSYLRKCTRIVILCGYSALEDYTHKHLGNKEIMNLLSAKSYDTGSAVKHLLNNYTEAKKIIQKLSEEKAVLSLGEVQKSPCGFRYVFADKLSTDDIVYCINHCKDNGYSNIVIFSGSDASGYRFALCSSDDELHNKVTTGIKEINGRGGGSSTFFQGQIKASKRDIENLLLCL